MAYQLGSHDTMTYLKPKNPWLRPFHFMAKCQAHTIEEQYEKFNCKMFDIRLKYNKKNNTWCFAHGTMKFEGDVESVFEYLNTRPEKLYVRMLLEYNRPVKDMEKICQKYVDYCIELRKKYSNLIFFEYRRKYDWKELYKYEGMPYPKIYLGISSMTLTILDDLWPWLYARTHNKDIIAQGTDKDWLLLDFVGKYY